MIFHDMPKACKIGRKDFYTKMGNAGGMKE